MTAAAAAAAAKKQLSHITHDYVLHMYGCYLFIFIFSHSMFIYIYFFDDTNVDSFSPVSIFYIRRITCRSLFLHHTQTSTLLMYLYCIHIFLFDGPFYVTLQRLSFQCCANILYERVFLLITIARNTNQ